MDITLIKLWLIIGNKTNVCATGKTQTFVSKMTTVCRSQKSTYKNLGVCEQRATIYFMPLAPSHTYMYKQSCTFIQTEKNVMCVCIYV